MGFFFLTDFEFIFWWGKGVDLMSLFAVCVCVCVCDQVYLLFNLLLLWRGHVPLYTVEDNFVESVLSFHLYLDSKEGSHYLSGKCLYPLSHLSGSTGPVFKVMLLAPRCTCENDTRFSPSDKALTVFYCPNFRLCAEPGQDLQHDQTRPHLCPSLLS